MQILPSNLMASYRLLQTLRDHADRCVQAPREVSILQEIAHETALRSTCAAFADGHAIGARGGDCHHDWINADANV
jgi:hypothetical protein